MLLKEKGLGGRALLGGTAKGKTGYSGLSKNFPFWAEKCRFVSVVFLPPMPSSGSYTSENMAVKMESDLLPPGCLMVFAVLLQGF